MRMDAIMIPEKRILAVNITDFPKTKPFGKSGMKLSGNFTVRDCLDKAKVPCRILKYHLYSGKMSLVGIPHFRHSSKASYKLKSVQQMGLDFFQFLQEFEKSLQQRMSSKICIPTHLFEHYFTSKRIEARLKVKCW
uniref:Uncharacterized protein n=1 Tax=Cacopsylla melanoneura TaxID=428564 RepID=A0A8D8X1F2_9HEMI